MSIRKIQNGSITISYLISSTDRGKPWLAYIAPFGFRLHLANSLINAFADVFNVVTWESRLILEPPEVEFEHSQLTVDKHVSDLMCILDHHEIASTSVVGYCSGAGIALAAVNFDRDRFTRLVLANGEYVLLQQTGCVTQYGMDIDSVLSLASQSEGMAAFISKKFQFDRPEDLSGTSEEFRLPFSKAHYLHRYAVNYLNYRAQHFEGLARSVACETLLLSGSADEHANVQSTRVIYEAIKNSQLVVDPEGDHYQILHNGSETLNDIKRFLCTVSHA